MDSKKPAGGIVGSLLDKASDFMDMFDGGAPSEEEEKTPVEIPRKPILRVSTLTGEWELSSDGGSTWSRCCNQPLPSGRLCQRVEDHLVTKCFNEDDLLGPLAEEIAAEERNGKIPPEFLPTSHEVRFKHIAVCGNDSRDHQLYGLDFHGHVWEFDGNVWKPLNMNKAPSK